jgi:LysM repeat protein
LVTAILLVAIAAGALAAGVSVLAQGQGDEGTRQPVAAPTAAAGAAADSASPGVAQPEGQPTPRPPMGATYHTVQAGETLGKIAANYGVTTVAIANANGLANPNMIRVGQKLIIPAR